MQRRRALETAASAAGAGGVARIDMPPSSSKRDAPAHRVRTCADAVAKLRSPSDGVARTARRVDDCLTGADRGALTALMWVRRAGPAARLGALLYAATIHAWLVIVLFSSVPASTPQ